MKPHPELPAAFQALGLDIPILKGLSKHAFTEPSDIQRELIPHIVAGRDVLGQARTGTGKTAAFVLPLLQTMDEQDSWQALVVVPTRELAAQVTAEFRRLAEFTQFKIVPVYGGQSVRHQQKTLGRKTHVVVGTPGRILDLQQRKILDFRSLKHVVLDEVDRMLDIGFIDDIRKILGSIKQTHQTIFVSATLDDQVKRLASRFLEDAVEVNVSEDNLTVDAIDQYYCTVDPWDKFRLLQLVLKQEDPSLAIVFTNTKHTARKLAKKLHDQGLSVKEIHGDLVQRKREKVMTRFRRHQIKVLVATDLAARGIDVQDVSHIVNYDLPQDKEVYVHRIGRTARMGAFGKAISFVSRDEGELLTQVEMLINREIPAFEYEGFKPRPKPEANQPQAAQQVVSRNDASVFGAGLTEGSDEPVKKPRRTLGGKFRPARRRR